MTIRVTILGPSDRWQDDLDDLGILFPQQYEPPQLLPGRERLPGPLPNVRQAFDLLRGHDDLVGIECDRIVHEGGQHKECRTNDQEVNQGLVQPRLHETEPLSRHL